MRANNSVYVLAIIVGLVFSSAPLRANSVFESAQNSFQNSSSAKPNSTSGPVLRDPTTPLLQKAISAGEVRLNLQAVYVRESGRTAIINNALLTEGTLISGWRIKHIRSNSVVVEKNGSTKTLLLHQPILK